MANLGLFLEVGMARLLACCLIVVAVTVNDNNNAMVSLANPLPASSDAEEGWNNTPPPAQLIPPTWK
jgi:hypothetical protein